ncbi:acyltransferase family protein [Campylobacter hyointestinalis]|uniref:acyltransferase family protein n=1 Tax=Campylobacter hyointestinalis TaxID=198 RepID=UPI000CE4FFE7|nr:acyltransferase family protein [Campylobacter hyointestinalis]PPB66233.1 hypothetical protein CDQ75_05400 [Campylobacter hyointestinalis subsp. hyointestinalis]
MKFNNFYTNTSLDNHIATKILWIDYLKIIGILAVILGHIASPFGVFIYSWHMPLFFIIAGFFIDTKLSIMNFIFKNFKRLMIPYFIFAIIGICAEIIKRNLLHRESLNYIYEIKGILFWMDMSSLSNTYSFVLWFLPTLFFGKIIIYFINKYIANIILRLFMVCFAFYLSFFINLPFAIDNALNICLFIFIGNIIYKFYQNNNLYLIAFIAICILCFCNIPILDIANKVYENLFINPIWAVLIISLFVCVFKKISYRSKIIYIIAENTMLLFIIHPYTNNIASIFVDKIFTFQETGGGWYLKLSISIFLLSIIVLIKQNFTNKGIFKYV